MKPRLQIGDKILDIVTVPDFKVNSFISTVSSKKRKVDWQRHLTNRNEMRVPGSTAATNVAVVLVAIKQNRLFLCFVLAASCWSS